MTVVKRWPGLRGGGWTSFLECPPNRERKLTRNNELEEIGMLGLLPQSAHEVLLTFVGEPGSKRSG